MPFRGFYNVMDVFLTWGFEGTRPIRTGAQWKSFWLLAIFQLSLRWR